jgi:type II secretory pathway component GspD/PulD (secretin)
MKRIFALLPILLLAACGASYNDEVRAPTEKELQEARSIIAPPNALREGVFHMQRVQTGSTVRVKDQIVLKKPDLSPFDVAYIGRDLESVVLELANAAGESVVLPQGLRNRTITVVHSGANFQEMLELVLGKAGYHYNYVNGIWYITRYPVRNYLLEISQSDRKGSLVSRAELTPELAAGTTTQGSANELDTAYSDEVWKQVRETLAELIKVGDTSTGGQTVQATGVSANGMLLNGQSAAAAMPTNNGLLPPPSGVSPSDSSLFPLAAGQASIVTDSNALPTVATPQSNDHTAVEDNASPWFKLTESAGLITVRASPEAHRQIEEYLEQVQASAHRQVVVEARIVALIKDKNTSRGADVQLNGRDVTGSALNRLGFFANSQSTLSAAGATVQGGFFTLASRAGDMALVLQSLSTLGDVYTISSPNLVARNNQISRVAVTRQLGYAETEVNQNTTSTGDVVIGSRQDRAKFKNSGTVMSVLPFIGRNNVQLRFRLSLATKAGETQIRTAIGGGTPVVNAVPELANNLIDQDMVLEYGRIYAIGGLIENNTTINNTYEPNLRQIPGVGEIFTRAKNRGQDTEFLVLLKVSRA